MRLWLTTVVVLFMLVELVDWLREMTVPLPISILAGLLLTILANPGKTLPFGLHSLFSNPAAESPPPPLPKPAPPPVTQRPQRSISFEIRRKPAEGEGEGQ